MKYFSSIRILIAKSWMRESRAFGAGRGKYRKGLVYSTNGFITEKLWPMRGMDYV